MKKLYYIAIIGLLIFEFLNVYFIMPMPGSQRMRSIEIAYFLYTWRWAFRGVLGLIALASFIPAFQASKLFSIGTLVVVVSGIYAFNFQMAADSMFYQPKHLQMLDAKQNKITKDRIVVGVVIDGKAKAYPISLIGYHHQVLDTLGGKQIMVTYCTVCRTGRVYEPIVNGKIEHFRLVGMDHFNAMFEDETTKSWWRQANGEAIIGQLKGQTLPELFSQQVSLEKWLQLYPNTLIMQPDVDSKEKYDSTAKYENGKSKSDLTRTDSLSWKDKSWVVGIEIGKDSKAFDWLRLKKERVINEQVGAKAIALVLSADNKSFFAFERPTKDSKFQLQNDTIIVDNQKFMIDGRAVDTKVSLQRVKAYQEFWHSWQTFHPMTQR
ncbi:hypothetical protein Emtol_1053 [Emticicia oligotrophica DSM 17448]|uniref:DUF3179 domain-containing protein n=1 Tax=Emticicia oligotrophica (strain DSM 17448 / CIP 109782 / MTCC 6937 / GPTSA100-15) TaxID=929562 RepID=A0ABN4AJF6_EMTOG|nr:DUF3179 domain-containing (seleno)protein [Emticicia oligotrophica]AFK02203.1 hypothetical protein Emtol_1053 [Emticicia oligotrophica DSM 17448]